MRRFNVFYQGLMLGLFGFLALAGTVKAADPVLINQNWLVPGGTVTGVVVDNDGTNYLAGAFNTIGPYTGSFVSLDASTGEHDKTFPKVVGTVNAAISDGLGGWYWWIINLVES